MFSSFSLLHSLNPRENATCFCSRVSHNTSWNHRSPEMPAQQPDLGRSPSAQVILGCIKQTNLNIPNQRPLYSWSTCRPGAFSVKHACSWSSLLTAWFPLRLQPCSSGYPSLGGAAPLIHHVRGPPQGCFCSLDVLFLFSDQSSSAVFRSYWEPLHLVSWSPFPRSSLCLWACMGIV